MATICRNCLRQSIKSRTLHVSSHPPLTHSFSVLNRPPPNYEGHIPLTWWERAGLAIGSGLGSFLDPRRGGNSIFKRYTYLAQVLTNRFRSHSRLRRSNRPTFLHRPPPFHNALTPNRPPNPARPSANHVVNTVFGVPALAA